MPCLPGVVWGWFSRSHLIINKWPDQQSHHLKTSLTDVCALMVPCPGISTHALTIWPHTRRAELDAVLQGPDVVGVVELNELKAVGFLHVLDPLIGLALRVYHQRPPSRIPGRAKRENLVQAITSFCTADSTWPQIYPSLVVPSFLSLK